MSNKYKSYTRLKNFAHGKKFPNKAQRSLCSVEKQYELQYKIGQGKHYKKHLSALNRSNLRSITSYVRAQLDKCLLLISRCLLGYQWCVYVSLQFSYKSLTIPQQIAGTSGLRYKIPIVVFKYEFTQVICYNQCTPRRKDFRESNMHLL